MATSVHTRIGKTIAAALVIAAVSAPSAAIGATGGSHARPHVSIDSSEPGWTGFVPVAAVTSVATGSGFDWSSALIGVGAGLGIALLCAGWLTAVRKRRRHRLELSPPKRDAERALRARSG